VATLCGNKFRLLYFATLLARPLSGFRLYISSQRIFRGKNGLVNSALHDSR
jgi:hypothetical protein